MNNRFYEMHNGASSLIQDGPKEYLLCADCEQKLSRHEKYFKEAVHLSRHGIQIVQNDSIAVISNLDYSKVKLFLLSVIWRMSVSSLPQFERISLGEHEDIIRRIIIDESPEETDNYSIGAMIPLMNGKIEEGWLCTPFVMKHGGGPIYAMIIGGILYLVCVARGSVLHDSKYLLNESGTWAMPLIEFDRIPFLKEFITSQFGNKDPSTDRTPADGETGQTRE